MEQNFPDNTLYEMDNLDVLRGMNSETVDLIATDPPFNTERNRSGTAGFYVDKWKWGDTGILPDQWKWNEVHPKWLEEIKDDNLELHKVIEATWVCHGEDIAAFLCFLSVRLLEMQRILKPTGSIFLHCDHTANSYIRLAMDAIFGKQNFRNEIVWKRTNSPTVAGYKLGTVHDTIFLYSKKHRERKLNPVFIPYTEEYIKKHFKKEDIRGKYQATPVTAKGTRRGYSGAAWRGVDITARGLHWSCPTTLPDGLEIPIAWESMNTLEKLEWLDANDMIYWPPRGKMPRFKYYLSASEGARLADTITDVAGVQGGSEEITGSPDQKPVKLYKRFIKAGSDEGDLVLDPFCGCATTIIAARELNRRWVGIDRRLDAKYHVVSRIAGIDAKERERLESLPDFADWVQEQMARYEAHYRNDPPERTDNGEPAAPALEQVIPVAEEYTLRHDKMHEILVKQFGLKCWGCGFEAPDERYLELDHIDPKSSGGSNQLDNRALLCRPCNQKKSNRLTLAGLWTENRRDGYLPRRDANDRSTFRARENGQGSIWLSECDRLPIK